MTSKLFKQIRKSEKGTSIAEMILVMGLIGILAAITVGSTQLATQRERIRTAARDLTSLLREAQTQSIEGQHRTIDINEAAPLQYIVEIDQDDKVFRLYTSQDNIYETTTSNLLIETIPYHEQIDIYESDPAAGTLFSEAIVFESPFGKVVLSDSMSKPLVLVFAGYNNNYFWKVTIDEGFANIDVDRY
ncbi:Tfp pilus assembly protein FimT/FimU [Patescibacteria group bacterium]